MRRPVKLLVVLALVAGGAALAFAGAAPAGFTGVADVTRDPAAFEGKDVEVKASVRPGSLDRSASPVTFSLEDGASVLAVRWDPAVPLPDHEAGGSIEGKNVVVKGTLERAPDGSIHLLAREMQVGCASKYRPAA